MVRYAIAPERLRWQPDDNELPAEGTRAIPALSGTLGQKAAVEALNYAIASAGRNQHVFLRGPRGSGRRRLLDSVFASQRPQARQKRDFCFVHNFSNPDRPRLIALARGEGRPFQKQMHRIAVFVRERLPEILANDPVRSRREARQEAAERDIRRLLRPLEQKLEAEGLALIRSQAGPNARLQVAMLIMGKPVSKEEFRNLVARKQASEEDRVRFEQRIESYDDEINRLARRIRTSWQQAQQEIEQIDITETARIMSEMTTEVSRRFRAEGIEIFLRELIDDVLEKRIGHDTSHLADPTMLYGVNVLNTGNDERGASVLTAGSISSTSLFGTIDPAWRRGDRAVASFQGIRSGALIQADGGFVILDAEDLASNPEAVGRLLRVLRAGEVEITTPADSFGQVAQSLRPEAVPVDVGIIIVGDEASYEQLATISRDFPRRFRLLADLERNIARDVHGIERTCQFISALVREEQLRPLTRSALAAMVEISARFADRPFRLSGQVARLAEIVREAAFLAGEDNESETGRDHVERAFQRIRQRTGLLSGSQVRQDIESGLLRLRGRLTGQLNIMVSERQAEETFGMPARLSVALSAAPTTTVALEGGDRMLPARPFFGPMIAELLRLDALPGLHAAMTLEPGAAFDQSEIRHSLLGQACVLLATLAGVSVRQHRAVTGSLDARGQVGRVDHINERIEGFFESCSQIGLNGQGIIIPAADRDRLVLDKAVVRACVNQKFHVFAVASIAEALEILTGRPAGVWNDGDFSEGSVFALARARLQTPA